MVIRHGVTALIAGAIGVVALSTAGTASGMYSANDTFLAEITAAGISYDHPQDVIRAAHDVCAVLDTGVDPVGLTPDRTVTFVTAAVRTYCPEYGTLFG